MKKKKTNRIKINEKHLNPSMIKCEAYNRNIALRKRGFRLRFCAISISRCQALVEVNRN